MPLASDLESAIASKGWAIPLLTLDSVAPFQQLMGLPLSEASPNLHQILQTATVTVRKQVHLALHGKGSPSTKDYFSSVSTLMGDAATRRFTWWLRHVFHSDPRDNIGLSRWMRMLRHCRHSADQWNRLDIPASMSAEILKRFQMAIDMKEFNRRLDEIQDMPLSDWDLHMYASQLYDLDDDASGITVNPFRTVKLTVREYQGHRFWAWVLRTLDMERLTRLWKSAQRIVHEDEIKSLIELPHPGTLDIGL